MSSVEKMNWIWRARGDCVLAVGQDIWLSSISKAIFDPFLSGFSLNLEIISPVVIYFFLSVFTGHHWLIVGVPFNWYWFLFFHFRCAGNGLLYCSIDNIPAQLPREASDYFGKLLLPWLPEMVRIKFIYSSYKINLDL